MELDKSQVAGRLRIAVRTLDWWVQKGDFPTPSFIGRRAFWLSTDVDLWIAKQFAPSGHPAAAASAPKPSLQPRRAVKKR